MKKRRKVNANQRKLDLKHPLLGRDSVRRLDLKSLKLLEQILKSDRNYLFSLSRQAEGLYQDFPQPEKTRWFQRVAPPLKKIRMLSSPADELKTIQKSINRQLLARIEMAQHCFGGVRGKSLLDNIGMHLGARCLLTLDISSFFPSIDTKKVFRVWHSVLGCSPAIAKLLTSLTVRDGRLPQGAPTSPAIANIYLMSIDKPIRDFCHRNGITYSSWVDDLAFSGENPRAVIPTVIHTLGRHGLRLSRQKIKVMGPGSKKVLTGILMNKYPSVIRSRFSQIRSGVHKLRIGEVAPDEMDLYLKSLDASIRFVENLIEERPVKHLSRLRADFDSLKRSDRKTLDTHQSL